MKKCPYWTDSDSPVSAFWKQELLRYLGETFKLDVLFETGTYEGATCQYLSSYFKEIHTIELSPYCYRQAKWRLANFPNVRQYFGSSDKVLKELLSKLPNVPALFWLDAHSSGGSTADEGDPLPGELQAIMTLRPDALIVIDDMKDAELRHIEEAGVSFDGWTREYRTGEVILYKNGRYDIPPFED